MTTDQIAPFISDEAMAQLKEAVTLLKEANRIKDSPIALRIKAMELAISYNQGVNGAISANMLVTYAMAIHEYISKD